MRILVLNWRDIRHPEAGGAERYLHSLCSEFVRLGHKVHVYSSLFPNAKTNEEIDGVIITRCGGRFLIYLSVYHCYLKDKTDYDIVIESINTIPFLARLYAKQPVVPLIYSINNRHALLKELGITPISLLAWLSNSLIPKIYRKSTVLTISETSRKELAMAGFSLDKVFVAKPTVSFDFDRCVEIAPKFGRPNFRIVYLGRLKKYKGLDVLLQAFAILRNSLPVELLIIGKGDYQDQLRRTVNEMGLSNCVQFAGCVDEDAKVLLLKKSSVFVCCSVDEGGWTIAGLEAMRCGVPLVVTESQRDLVLEGVTGFVVSPKPEIIADKIRAVLDGDWAKMSIASIRLSASATRVNSAAVALTALNSAIGEFHFSGNTENGNLANCK